MSAERAGAIELEVLRILRLSGEPAKAMALAQELKARDRPETERAVLNWEQLCLEAARTHSLTAMLAATGRKGSLRNVQRAVETCLWARAMPSVQWLEKIPTASSLGQGFADELRKDGLMKPALKALRALEKVHDTAGPLSERLDQLGKALASAPTLPTLEQHLLFLAAATRSLVRLRQSTHAYLAFTEYRLLSRQASCGRLDDVLRLLPDVAIEPA